MPICDTCKKFMLDSEVLRHKCPPRFECIDLDDLDDFEDFEDSRDPDDGPPTWTPVYDSTAGGAAEKFAEMRLEREGTLRVRVRNPHGVFLDLIVRAESQLHYDASAEGSAADPERWKREELALSLEFHKMTAETKQSEVVNV